MPVSTEQFLEENKLFKLVLALSLPVVISGLVETLYNTIDAIFVGHFVGNQALSALSVINVIQLFYIALGTLFSVGVASIISRSLGVWNEEKAVQTMITGLFFAFLIGSIIDFLILINLEFCIKMIGGTDEIMFHCKEYGKVIVAAGVMIPMNLVLMGAFRAKGAVKIATLLNIVATLLNIGLDALFIIFFGWGVGGAAIATIISQGLLFFTALIYIRSIYSNVFSFYTFKQISVSILRDILKIGFSTSMRLIFLMIVHSLANLILGPFGSEYLSAYGIFYRIIMVVAIIVICLPIGSQPVIGFNYGAQKYKRVKKIMFITMGLGFGVSFLTSLLLLWSPEFLFYIFTKDSRIIQICQEFSRIQALTYCGWGIYLCVSEMLLAMGRVRESLFLSFSYPIVTAIGFLSLPKFFGLLGAYLAYPIAYFIIGVYALIVWFRELKLLQFKMDNLKKSY